MAPYKQLCRVYIGSNLRKLPCAYESKLGSCIGLALRVRQFNHARALAY